MLLPELQATFRAPMLQVSDLSPCLTSHLEGTDQRELKGLISQTWTARVGMGNPGPKMALLAGSLLSRASLGQKGKSWGTRWVFAHGV